MRWKWIICLLTITTTLLVQTVFSTPNKNQKVIEVYILAGQSNAVGYNNTDTYSPTTFPIFLLNQPEILFWPGSNAVDSLKNCWTSLQVGASKVGRKAFGPEIAFGQKMSIAKKEAQIAIIKYAVGGAGIARSKDYHDYIPGLKDFNDKGYNWYPPQGTESAGQLYKNLLQNINDALTSLRNQKKKFRIAGFIWMQGEHEAGLSLQMAKDYHSLLSSFFSCVLNDIGDPQLPVVIGQISNKWIYKEEVKVAQQKLCNTNSNFEIVTTYDLPRTPNDNSHYTANGMVELGARFAQTMLNIQKKQQNKN